MRKISTVKASLFTLIFAFLAIGMIAKASVTKKEKAVKETAKTVVLETWYFTPNPSNPDPDLASNYSLIPPPDLENCGTEGEDVCTIQDERSESSPNQPKMSHGSVLGDTANDYNKTFKSEN